MADPGITNADGPRPCTWDDLQLLRTAAQVASDRRLRPSGRQQGADLARRLTRLDLVYGAALAEQRQGELRLTVFGHQVLAAAEAHHGALATVVKTAAQLDDQVLSVTASEPVGDAVVERFARGTGKPLAVYFCGPPEALARYHDHRVDSVYAWWAEPPVGQVRRAYEELELGCERLGVRLPYGHPALGAAVVSLSDLRDDPWVSEPGPGRVPVVASAFRRAGLAAPARLQVAATPSQVRSAAACGRALTLASLAPEAPTDGSVVVPPVERPIRSLLLVTDPARVPAQVADGFLAAHRNVLPLPAAGERRWVVSVPGEATGRPMPSAAAELGPDTARLLAGIVAGGSINRAAAALAISQPALTRRIQRLEAALNLQLLIRSSRGARLTEAGLKVLQQLQAAERRYQDAVTPPAPAPVGYARRAEVMRPGPGSAVRAS